MFLALLVFLLLVLVMVYVERDSQKTEVDDVETGAEQTDVSEHQEHDAEQVEDDRHT